MTSGSITQLERSKPRSKCRKWQLRVSLGYDPRTGKYPIKTRCITGTYTEAKDALRKFQNELEAGLIKTTTSRRLSFVIDEFISREYALKEKRPTYIHEKEAYLRNFLEFVNDKKIDKITAADIERYRIHKLNNGMKRSSANIATARVRSLFKYALEVGYISHDPFDKIKRLKSDAEEKEPIPSDTYHQMIQTLDPYKPYEMFCLLCLTSGLRRGEALGLTFADIDFDTHTITVSKQLTKEGKFSPLKTKASRRTQPIPAFIVDALQLTLDKRMSYYHKVGLELPPLSTVPVITAAGTIDSPSVATVYKNVLDIGKRYGLEKLTPHLLRHTYLTELARNNIHPSVMQRLAGHSTIDTTLGIYTHINLQEQTRAVKQVFEDSSNQHLNQI